MVAHSKGGKQGHVEEGSEKDSGGGATACHAVIVTSNISGFTELQLVFVSRRRSFAECHGTIFDAVYSTRYLDNGELDIQVGFLPSRCVYTFQQLERHRFLVPSGLTCLSPTDVRNCIGNPQSDEDAPPPHAKSTQRAGDVQLCPESTKRTLWDEEFLDIHHRCEVTTRGAVSVIPDPYIISVRYAMQPAVNSTQHCMVGTNSWGERTSLCHECGRDQHRITNADIGHHVDEISDYGVTSTTAKPWLIHLYWTPEYPGSFSERFHNLCYTLRLDTGHRSSTVGSAI